MRNSYIAILCAGAVLGAGHASAQKQGQRISVPSTDYVYQYVPPQPRQQDQRQPAAQMQKAIATNYTSGYQESPIEGSRSVAPTIAYNAATRVEPGHSQAIYTGFLQCELGDAVLIEADTYAAGHYKMQHGQSSYRLNAVPTSTGAIRLEDQSNGIVWLQLANKSMLLDQNAGTRLADECNSVEQMAQAQAMRANPSLNLLQ